MKKILSVIIVLSFFVTSSVSYVGAIDDLNSENTTSINDEVNNDEKTEINQGTGGLDDNQDTVDNLNDKENDENQKTEDSDIDHNNDEDKNSNSSIENNSENIQNPDDVIPDIPTTIEPQITYATHVQDYGWMNYVSDGNMSGTQGKSKRLEAIKINLIAGDVSGSVSYSTHIQNIGWTNYVDNDKVSGTSGQKLRLEAIKIKLTGDIANYYDVYYRVHVQDYGWLDWASNGACAGSQTYAKRLEAIEIRLVKKGQSAPGSTANPFKSPGKIYYSTHIQDYGWQNYVGDGKVSGSIGASKRIEAIKLNVSDLPYSGGVEYSTHVENIGWQGYRANENMAGTVGKSLKVEAIKIHLTGELANHYDIYYRLHIQNYGWLDWAKNDEKAGSEGVSLRAEAIEVQLVEKNGVAPGNTTKPYVTVGNVNYSSHVQNYGWMKTLSNGAISGTVEQSLRMEAIQISLGENQYSGNIEYTTHVQDAGWLNYVSNGAISGTIGNSKRIEAIKIRLTGEIANYYDVYYRVQCQAVGWLDWTCNDRVAGTVGGSYRVEAMQVKLVPKYSNSPGISNRSSISFAERNGFKICYDANGRLYEDAQSLLGLRGSYVLRVNKQTNVVTVLIQNGEGVYNIAYKRFICSVGNDTPTGVFYTPAKYRWKLLMGPSYGQYSTRIVGGILFHSVPYNQQNPYTLSPRMYNQLGTTCSHGCVRLTCGDAKWIYDNCTLGTRVDILWGSDPLSKPSAQKLPLNQTWDPTDPNI